ncbi:Alpha/Beta hydrolase protein [Cyathus striatus]|nr:Alpha/Beta hydrolase protein [Cyathus striatus]
MFTKIRWAAFTIVALNTSSVFTASNVVDLGYAKYQGFVNPNNSNTNFLGIRFAASPTGTFRFRAPQPPEITPGIQQADAFSSQCFSGPTTGVNPVNPFRTGTISTSTTQSTPLNPEAGISEDCLFLNVYIPGSLNTTQSLPVLAWIHGGGYTYGDGLAPGDDIIKFSNGVIFVSIQYRLGVFGFLAGEEVKKNGDLNAGILDQQFALKWVQKHIHKFGGDPTRVTIWGLSAGAGSVLQHIVANDGSTSPPLFRGAITSSTYLPSQYAYNDDIPEAIFTQVSNQTGCATTKDRLACLRSVDANTLEEANDNIGLSAFYGTFAFVPVVDGEFITKRPTEILQSGRVNGDVVLSFTNTFEGTAFVNASTAPSVKTAEYISQLFPTLGQAQISAAAAVYADQGTQIDQVIAIMGESIIICPTYYLLRAFKGRSFKGEFAIPPGLHADDLYYYYPSLNENGVPPYINTAFDTAFPDSFVDFTMTMNPNLKHNPADIKPFWGTFHNGSTEMLFNKTDTNVPVIHTFSTSPELLKRCELRRTALTIFILHVSSVFTASNVVDLGYAKYEGFVNPSNSNTNFLGVRFAAAPTGASRFRAPQPPATTPGIQQANALSAQCFTAGAGSNPVDPFKTGNFSTSAMSTQEKRAADATSSEDCLFLNVYVPGALDTTRSLPVLVWIHGGGYEGGDGSDPGNDLIKFSGGLIIVTLQYRLGVFGFLAGEEVKKNGDLNAGMLDQQFALKWVQNHIRKFGGDPTRVTIWGESAGAGSVLQHIVADGGHTTPPLFRAAITSSTFLPSQYAFNDVIPEGLFTQIANQTGCATAKDRLACLRAVDVNTLQDANVNTCLSVFFGTFAFVPVVDGTFITKRPIEILQSGRVNGDVLLSVTNTFEGAAFVDASTAPTVQTAQYVSQLFPKLGQAQISAVAAAYADVGTPINQVIGVMGESIFICPTYFLLQTFKGRSFKGEFAIPPGGHGQDVAYYFTSQNANGVPGFNNSAFDTAFPDSFIDFAMTLNPNLKHNPADVKPLWSTWSNGNTEMLFNKTDSNLPVIHTVTTSSALLKRCAIWESVGALTGQ